MFSLLRDADPESYEIFREELGRQRETLELIASENFALPPVLAAAATVLTNKYAEGYPGKRYYGGCEAVDKAESLAISRAKALFGAQHANVQPHSGSHANMAAYFALLKPGDRIMAMDLAHGGHLTHGSPVNFSGTLFQFDDYGVSRETEQIDYDEVMKRAKEIRPKLIMVGASAYPRLLDFARFRKIADAVGAFLVADIAHIAGLVAAKLHPDPIPYCDVVTSTTHKTLRGPRSGLILCREEHAKAIDRAVFPFLQGGPLMHIILSKAVAFGLAMKPEFREYQQRILEDAQTLAASLMERGTSLISGGTDNHLLLIDLRKKEVNGKQLQEAFESAGMTTSRSMVPFDERKPYYTSGVRIGTPAVASRGMGPKQMVCIANWLHNVMEDPENEALLRKIRGEVRDLCAEFPLYPEFS